MRLLKIDPPGTWLQTAAVFDMLERYRVGKRFLEVGCGDGSLSRRLLERGFTGTGVDLSDAAIASARENLKGAIGRGKYLLHAGPVEHLPDSEKFDLGISMMVIEHVEDPVRFVTSIAARVRPGGIVVLGVPGRKDHWSVEDETVGHLRRYEKDELARVLEMSGLEALDVWSVSVPVANLLFRLGNRMVERSDSEMRKRELRKTEQTLTSGVREVPFKTVFPAPFRLILNRWTMLPFALLQRLFYRSSLGITLLACGRLPSRGDQHEGITAAAGAEGSPALHGRS